MISFRLTAEEYDRFRELCCTSGTRSVSELARAAINSLLKHPGSVPADALEYRILELEGRVHMLGLELKRLSQNESQASLSSSTRSSSLR
jgi:hypothetical protein